MAQWCEALKSLAPQIWKAKSNSKIWTWCMPLIPGPSKGRQVSLCIWRQPGLYEFQDNQGHIKRPYHKKQDKAPKMLKMVTILCVYHADVWPQHSIEAENKDKKMKFRLTVDWVGHPSSNPLLWQVVCLRHLPKVKGVGEMSVTMGSGHRWPALVSLESQSVLNSGLLW